MSRVVYRVEHPATNRGPYNPGWMIDCGLSMPEQIRIETIRDTIHRLHEDDPKSHPEPSCFKRGVLDPGLVCGFISRKAYEDWFNDWCRMRLAEAGYELLTYIADDGDDEPWSDHTGQTVFQKQNARVVDREPCARLELELTPLDDVETKVWLDFFVDDKV